MENRVGAYLRDLRAIRKIPVARLAERAGLVRSTISRWENGAFQPRIPELESLLNALGASEEERRKALTLIDAPRAIRQSRQNTQEQIPWRKGEPGLLPVPCGGDLLRAMRRRRRLSQDQVAASLRVHRSMVAYWERSRTTPPPDLLVALFDLLAAYPEERAVLSDSFLWLAPPQEPDAGWEILEVQIRQMEVEMNQGARTLMDLRFLSLEARLVPLAQRRAALLPLLADLYRLHSRWLWWRARGAEAKTYADSVLEVASLNSDRSAVRDIALDAIHISAGIVADAGTPASSQRALQRLRDWIPLAIQSKEKAMLYRGMADFLSRMGQTDGALECSERSQAFALETDDETLIEMSRYNHSCVLFNVGLPDKALSLLRVESRTIPIQSVNEALQWSNVLMAIGQRSDAAHWLNSADEIITRYDLPQFRRRIDDLESRFGC